MLSAAKALLLTPVPGPRSAASGARRRVVPHLPAVLQTAAAAVAAWYVAVLVLGVARPAFAAIAAVICVGVTYGERRWRALELVGGVVLGITVASVLLFLIGTGPLQIALLVVIAMTAALLVRGGDLLVNEAAISAILLASLQTANAGFSADRIVEGLIGGGVGLVVASLLLPPDPVAMVSRVAQNVVGKLGRTLEEAAEALASGDVQRATALYDLAPSPLLTQIVGQVRSVAVDLVRAADQLGEPGAPEWSQPTEELLAVAPAAS
jgi:uncharacterized membrane protein YccC